MNRNIWATILLATGAVGAWFLIFATLFSDGPADKLAAEYVVVYGVIIAFFGAIAWAATRYGPWGRWTPAFLGAPGLIILVAYQDPALLLRGLILLALVAGLAGGTLVARRATA